MNDELLNELETRFILEGWTYKIDGEQILPSREDLERVLSTMRNMLAKEPEVGMPQIELGRMIMKKRDGHYDVFVYLGEYNND